MSRLWWLFPCVLGCTPDGGPGGKDSTSFPTDPTANNPTTPGGGTNPTDTDPTGDPAVDDPGTVTLSTATGCSGVYNPDQLLDLHLELDPADWALVLADTTFELFVPATFWCGDEEPLVVGVRRKRSGGAQKVGLKVDFNEIVDDQSWQGLKKLSLENGVSSGSETDDASVGDYVAEYLAWRIMQLSGGISGRAAFASLTVNDDPLGVYVNVEQVDKTFLDSRLGDDEGWLYKKSGGVDDGFKTHETDGLDDPYDDWFCFLGSPTTCDAPADDVLLTELPARLDIEQILTLGAAMAYIGNTDTILFKDNNYYWYDYDGGPRVYFPWDLDTTMRVMTDVRTGSGIPGGSANYDDLLFIHWEADYHASLADMVEVRAPASIVQNELDRAAAVAGAAFDADPYVSGTMADAVDSLGSWWTDRETDVRGQLGL
jgi:hypothetical protein